MKVLTQLKIRITVLTQNVNLNCEDKQRALLIPYRHCQTISQIYSHIHRHIKPPVKQNHNKQQLISQSHCRQRQLILNQHAARYYSFANSIFGKL